MNQESGPSEKVLRFRKSERLFHWAISIPFVVCYVTALVLVVIYNNHPLLPYRNVFSWIHRISGICLIVLPPIVILTSRSDFKLYYYNIRQAWAWTMEDFKFLFLIGLANINKKIKLPEQGKFNAAEKLNFMVLMCTSPLYIITGILIWPANSAILYWFIHLGLAVLSTPLILGHIFMAMFNPETRVAMSGMISGFVDRQYVKHHHGRWYKEQFKNEGVPDEDGEKPDADSKGENTGSSKDRK